MTEQDGLVLREMLFSQGRSYGLILVSIYFQIIIFSRMNEEFGREMDIYPSVFRSGTLDWDFSLHSFLQKDDSIKNLSFVILTLAWSFSYLSTENLGMSCSTLAKYSVYTAMFLSCLYGFHLLIKEVSFWYKMTEIGICIVLLLCNLVCFVLGLAQPYEDDD